MIPEKGSSALRIARYEGVQTCLVTSRCSDPNLRLSPQDRQVVVDALRWLHDQDRILLHAFVVMSDHFHALLSVRPDHQLPQVVHSLKSYTANSINRLRNTAGEVWQAGYRDDSRLGDKTHFALKAYVEENPVRAGLAKAQHDYAWSSANDRYCRTVDPLL